MQIITVTSRYMLFNNSSEPLQYGQRGTSLVWQLPPGARYPFHWDSADSPFQLCIRPAQGDWNWSGAFQVRLLHMLPAGRPLLLHSIAHLAHMGHASLGCIHS